MSTPTTLEAARDQMKEWIWSGKFGSLKNFDLRIDTSDPSAGRHRVVLKFNTITHSYSVVGKPASPVRPPESDTGYLGCVMSDRLPLAGETWTRGSDLADGSFSRATWDRIVQDILSAELSAAAEVEA
jgi:hypothetical protein